MQAKRKVLISMLGTGTAAKDDNNTGYARTDYSIDGEVYKDNTLVALPLMEHLQIDDLYLIGTKSSMWDNIVDAFENTNEKQSSMKNFFNRIFKTKSAYSQALLEKISRAKKGEKGEVIKEEDLEDLNKLINSKLESKKSKCFLVEDAQNDEELWAMFEKFIEIFKTLDDENAEVELYLDVTHAFRSIAMFSVIMAQFSKIKLNTKVAGIYYGQYIKDKSQASPILNLSIFFEILDWAQAIKIFKHYGNASELLRLMEKNGEVGEVKRSFKNFSDALSVSDLSAIQLSLKQVKLKLDYYRKHNKILVNSLAEELSEFLAFFDGIEDEYIAQFQYKFALYFAKNGNYAMAYTALLEAIISALCESENKNPENIDDRKNAKDAFKASSQAIIISKKKSETARKYYWKINKIRNNIAHKTDTFKSGIPAPSQAIENFKLYSDFFAPLFQ